MKVQTTKDDIVFVGENSVDTYQLGAIFGWVFDNCSKRDFHLEISKEVCKISVRKNHLLHWFIRDGNYKEYLEKGKKDGQG